LLDIYDLVALASVRAAFACMFVEHLVEILPPHLIGVRRTVADRPSELVGVVTPLVVRLEIRTRLEHAERAHFVEYTQALEYGKIHRQQRFADMKARVMRLLERNDPVAAPRQQCRSRTACGAPADHRHVAQLDPLRHSIPRSVSS
jgi:hypothetical protein